MTDVIISASDIFSAKETVLSVEKERDNLLLFVPVVICQKNKSIVEIMSVFSADLEKLPSSQELILTTFMTQSAVIGENNVVCFYIFLKKEVNGLFLNLLNKQLYVSQMIQFDNVIARFKYIANNEVGNPEEIRC